MDPGVELHGEIVPEPLTGLAAGLLGHPLQDGGARVPRCVDPMTEAHQASLLGERRVGEGIHLIEAADLEERAHHRLPRAAMECPLHGAHAAGHGRVHVGERRRDHPRRERRGVQLVLCVEGEARVEGAGRHVGRLLAGQHVEEVGGVRQLLRWLDGS